MKHIAFISILLSTLCLGCGEENRNNNLLQSLEGTQWKLEGIVDTETGILEVLEPKDCEECYSLIFDTDTTLVGKSTSNILSGNYKINYDENAIFIYCGPNTYMGEYSNDGYLYVETINKVQSFSKKRIELKLYYNKNKKYLLYKRTQP